MKKLLLILCVTGLYSCTTTYYQVYKAAPVDKTVKSLSNYLAYEDDNCIIAYRFWGNGGNIGFEFHNKTNKNIYLHLDECFFVSNGIAYNYYKDRIFTQSKSNTFSESATYGSVKSFTYGKSYYNSWLNELEKISASVSIAATSSKSAGNSSTTGSSVAYKEEKIVCIPSNASKYILEYKIKEDVYRECGYLRFPSVREITTKAFSKESSPLVFSNKIAYSFENENIIRFETMFYIAEITNYPRSAMFKFINDYCEKQVVKDEVFKDPDPDKFYIMYSKEGSSGNGRYKDDNKY